MSKGNSGLFNGTSGDTEQLILELEKRHEKFSKDDMVAITKTKDGKIVWLEKGHLGLRASGLIHIFQEHQRDFESAGIRADEIVDYIMKALQRGNRIGTQGRSRAVYEVEYNGKIRKVAIEIGSNGYIVSANPRS